MKPMLKGTICLSFSLLLSQGLYAQTNDEPDPFAELDAEIAELNNEGSEAEMKEFQQWKESYLAEYQKFRQEHFQKLDDIRDKLINTWGESEVSTQAKFVEYDDRSDTKTVVDFEKNEIRISVLHDAAESVDLDSAVKALEKTAKDKDGSEVLKQAVGSKIDSRTAKSLLTKAKREDEKVEVVAEPEKVVEKEVALIAEQANAQKRELEKVYDLASEQTETPETKADEVKLQQEKAQIDKESQARIAALKQKTAAVENNKRDELTKKKVTTFTIPLQNKRDLDKAKPYLARVESEAERWELPPSLMLAIMHTESYFNPKAQSHIPAFGLMQIVPRTAGIDVNRFLYNKDAPMEETQLLQANPNIEAGVAYMHILYSRYLKAIDNPESRTYCVIAAYNTGSGNVAKTFSKDGSRNINKAAEVINNMTPEQVYQRLVEQLPYDETRQYVKKVTNRRNIYRSLDSI